MESDEQKALINFVWHSANTYPGITKIYSVPNGGSRSYREDAKGNRYSPEAVRLRAEGLVSGRPDLHLDLARGGYHGLRIEMKWNDNTPSPEQWQIIKELNEDGYCAVICWNWQDAAQVLVWYMLDCIADLTKVWAGWNRPYVLCRYIRRRKTNDNPNATAKRGTEHFTAAEYQANLGRSKSSLPRRPNKRARRLDG